MNPVKFLGDALRTASQAIGYLWQKQGEERQQLVSDLQAICSRCEKAYSSVIKKLRPIKDTFGDRQALSAALRTFAADSATRNAFKPEHLCGEVDQLLQRMKSNADWLKYSVDIRRIERLTGAIAQMGNYDGQLWDYYDDYTRAMDEIATQLQSRLSKDTLKERMTYARHVVTQFEDDLSEALREIRAAKDLGRASM